ncbi:DNA damage-inducible protein 1 [Dimargaris cristalligena]|nr:DNA damage-inducible protein 1 [Dimargaris cristalligena]
MLFINCTINRRPIKALVDSGATNSCIEPHFADTCGLTHLIDTRFEGEAVGVGTAKIIGRIHHAELVVGGRHLVCKLDVINNLPIEIIIGLDMLQRHRATIDLPAGAMILDGVSIPFLQGHEAHWPSSDAHWRRVPDHSIFNAPTTSPTRQHAPGYSTVRVPTTSPTSRFSETTIAQIVKLGASREKAICLLTETKGNVDMARLLFLFF